MSAYSLLKRYRLCSWCIERLTGERIDGYERCYICGLTHKRFDELTGILIESLKGYEFDTFSLGIRAPLTYLEREDEVRSAFGIKGGSGLKKGVISELLDRLPFSDKARIRDPDLTAILDIEAGEVEIYTKPVFLMGRYLKLRRGIPQKRRRGYRSISEMVSSFIADRLGSKGVRITWIGGEDINSLVLGKGRPFVARAANPRRRSIEFEPVRLDGIELIDLKILPSFIRPDFVVEAVLHVIGSKPPIDVVKGVRLRIGGRERSLYEARVLSMKGGRIDIYVRCDGGIGIRDLVKGRGIEPSLESLLGTRLDFIEDMPFDIIDVIVKGKK